MAKLQLSQAWITNATSSLNEDDDVYVAGALTSQKPSPEELSQVVRESASNDAMREMIRRKWFTAPAASRSVRSEALTHFLFAHSKDRPSNALEPMFRRTSKQADLVQELSTIAWLCRAADIAASRPAARFDRARVGAESIKHLVRLSTRKSGPRAAIDYVEAMGIRVVVESSLPGMKTDGASFYSPKLGPVICLSLRYDRLDSFWFTLLHELAHVMLHLREESDMVFIDSLDDDELEYRSESELEAEADAFAKDSFIPRDAWLRSEAFRFGTEKGIIELAGKWGVHPAIVAGRLRFERRKYQAFTHLLGAGLVRSILFD